MTYSVWAVYCLLFGVFYIFRGDQCEKNDLAIKTESGAVLGSKLRTPTGKHVRVFLGLPYAIPPVGVQRFRPPVDFVKWSGVLNGKSKPAGCIQVVPRYLPNPPEWLVPYPNGTSEDCLYLNIWVPDPKPTNAPVMVWIHGGGFAFGHSGSVKYDGQILASEERVIVVSMNYRLSVFGFLYFGGDDVPGNLGLMDQSSALRWVKRNIRSFGGDPGKVTLFGESAGSACVGILLLTPSNRNLFQRVIMESGSPFDPWAISDKRTALDTSMKLAASVGCTPYPIYDPHDLVKCLQQIPVHTLVQSTRNLNIKRAAVTFTPVVDGFYIPDHPDKIVSEVSKDIEVLLGTNTGDGVFVMLAERVLPLSEDAVVTYRGFVEFVYALTQIKWHGRAKFILDLVRFFYTDWSNPHDPFLLREQIVDFADDFFFNCGTCLLSDYLALNGNNVYRYWFDVRPSTRKLPLWARSYHGVEMDFVFGLPLDASNGFTEKETLLSRNLMKMWADFARNGRPQSFWPAYNILEKNYLKIQLDSFLTEKGIRNQACALWNYLIPKLKSIT